MSGLPRRVLQVFGILLGALVLIGLTLYGVGWYRLNRGYPVQPRPVTLPEENDVLVEGQRIFRYRGCEACHGKDLGGLVYLDNPAIGMVATPNLTAGKGGIGDQRSDLDLVQAVRHGLDPNGKPLLFMPSTEFYYLSDKDLGAVLGYIRSNPPVNNQPPSSQLSATGFAVMNLTREITFLPAELIPHDQNPPPAPAPGITPEFGEYLALSCPVCHGIAMSGGEIPGFPPEWPAAGNLTPGKGSRLPGWGVEGFIDILQDGEKHGRAIHPDYMPWTSYRYLNDLEMRALYSYLMSLDAMEYGEQ